MNKPEMTLRVPGQREYALVLRLALGGVAILKDLDAGALDDLRNADKLTKPAFEIQFIALVGDEPNVAFALVNSFEELFKLNLMQL